MSHTVQLKMSTNKSKCPQITFNIRNGLKYQKRPQMSKNFDICAFAPIAHISIAQIAKMDIAFMSIAKMAIAQLAATQV